LDDDDRSDLAARGIPVEERGHSSALLEEIDAVVLSPGVVPSHPVLAEAARRGLAVLSEIDLVTLHAPERTMIAVTGTNGKGSTVRLIEAMLAAAGVKAHVGGNIGTPAISLVNTPPDEPLVLEVSSFQLEQSVAFRPDVAVLLNLTPDHLDRHGTMAGYAAAKSRLFRLQGPDDVAIFPAALKNVFAAGRARRVFYDGMDAGRTEHRLGLPPHVQSNLAAAAAACRALVPGFEVGSVSDKAIRAALHTPHRLDPVGSVSGVRIIDDSKSTNAASTVAAVRATEGPIVLLVGGRWKQGGYQALAGELNAIALRGMVLYGEARDALRGVFRAVAAPVIEAPDLGSAVAAGLDLARAGDTLLFSPACSSYDAFANCLARGDAFVALIRRQSGFLRP